jgi:3-methyladenine DNA glycosylase AlkC
MEPLKNIYSLDFYNTFSEILVKSIDGFDKELFIKEILVPGFKEKTLKERMRHTALVLHNYLPENFSQAVKMIEHIIIRLQQNDFEDDSFVFIFIPDYIELYGIDDFENSIKTIESVTQFVSCEFAVRPFILKYGKQMIKQMIRWSLHENYKVRRLASEGCRPRLPWTMALPFLKSNPVPILPVLENLKSDPHEWVRHSVANNLNDIAKDNPTIVIDIAGRWKGLSKETDAIVKHGCRTLLKQGHPEVLKLFSLENKNLRINHLIITEKSIKIGETLNFSFEIINEQAEEQMVRMEYGIYYRKANGTLSRKVFKISERLFAPFEKSIVNRNQSFRLITTRKFYSGEHKLSIIINGKEMSDSINFYLSD